MTAEAPIPLYLGAAAVYARDGLGYQWNAIRQARPNPCSPWMEAQRRKERLDEASAECWRRARVNFRRAKRSEQRGRYGGIIY